MHNEISFLYCETTWLPGAGLWGTYLFIIERRVDAPGLYPTKPIIPE